MHKILFEFEFFTTRTECIQLLHCLCFGFFPAKQKNITSINLNFCIFERSKSFRLLYPNALTESTRCITLCYSTLIRGGRNYQNHMFDSTIKKDFSWLPRKIQIFVCFPLNFEFKITEVTHELIETCLDRLIWYVSRTIHQSLFIDDMCVM